MFHSLAAPSLNPLREIVLIATQPGKCEPLGIFSIRGLNATVEYVTNVVRRRKFWCLVLDVRCNHDANALHISEILSKNLLFTHQVVLDVAERNNSYINGKALREEMIRSLGNLLILCYDVYCENVQKYERIRGMMCRGNDTKVQKFVFRWKEIQNFKEDTEYDCPDENRMRKLEQFIQARLIADWRCRETTKTRKLRNSHVQKTISRQRRDI